MRKVQQTARVGSLMMMLIAVLCLLLVSAPLGAQEISAGSDSIPEALWRPQRGESPRYPRDLIIGSLARGNVSDGARLAATQVLSALVAGNRSAAVFSRFDASSRNGLFSTVALVEPRKYRLGEGREEADGSYSFLVRFIGREQGIAGELYVRFEPAQEAAAGSAAASGSGAWLLDDLLLEEQRPLGDFTEEAVYDLPPYERLF